jgi:hypothetical protein
MDYRIREFLSPRFGGCCRCDPTHEEVPVLSDGKVKKGFRAMHKASLSAR